MGPARVSAPKSLLWLSIVHQAEAYAMLSYARLFMIVWSRASLFATGDAESTCPGKLNSELDRS